MAVKIKFDNTHNAIHPTVVLATRSGRRLGAIPVKEFVFSNSLNDGSSISFSLDMADCIKNGGNLYEKWNQTTDFKLVWIKDWDKYFEISVSIDEDDSMVKRVVGTSLGEAELSQINLYSVWINTEDDIMLDDYKPSVFYNEDDKKHSILHRVISNAPHYHIGHVDNSLKTIQRTFSFNETNILDALHDISEEINCLIMIDCHTDSDGRISREINAYDLEAYCVECGKRGDFNNVCEYCGSENIIKGYGEDTQIFVSTDNIAESIQDTSDTGSVKNCFKLEAGDELMTAVIASCDPSGTGYIWNISPETKEDMSEELVSKLDEYDTLYASYQSDYSVAIPSDVLLKYNNIARKYKNQENDFNIIASPISGYPAIMNAYFDTIDLYYYLNNSMMPSVTMINTNASKQIGILLSYLSSTVIAVKNIDSATKSTVDSTALSLAKVAIDQRYQVKITESSFSNNVWRGKFKITNYSNEDDTAESDFISRTITGDYEEYIKQSIKKAAAKYVTTGNPTDISGMFDLGNEEFKSELSKYGLASLNSIHDACQACIDIMIQNGVADNSGLQEQNSLYTNVYLQYYTKLGLIENEIAEREEEISAVVGSFDQYGDIEVAGMQNIIDDARKEIRESLRFEDFVGAELMLELSSYRRDDVYKNANYISDGLNNAELFKLAMQFIEVARKEISKASVVQHSFSATLGNLLAINEFSKIIDNFELGNWIRIRSDRNVYRLRLIKYQIDFDKFDEISVEFSDAKKSSSGYSDIKSIIDSASSMATSYNTVMRQAKKGSDSNSAISGWVENGLSMTQIKIVNDADNQNVTFDSHGISLKEYDQELEKYDDRQVKIINRGIYITDDNWRTSKVGVGDFMYYNPKTKQFEQSYGIIADVLVGGMVLSEEAAIYNESGSIEMDNGGITIIADTTTTDDPITQFKIQKKYLENGEVKIKDQISIDTDGNVVINGNVKIGSSSDNAPTLNGILSGDDLNLPELPENIVTAVDILYALGESESIAPTDGWTTNAPSVEHGKYLWQKTATYRGDDISYSEPTNISISLGDDGKSAFEIAVENGFSGTEQEWLHSLIGAQGEHGLNSATVFLYKRSKSGIPVAPTGRVRYTFATGAVANAGGWLTSIPVGTDPCYVTQATAISKDSYDDIESSEWTPVALFAQNGIDGAPGANGKNTAVVYLYKRSNTPATVDWRNKITYSFTDKKITDAFVPANWHREPPSEPDGEPLYITAATASSVESTDEIEWSEWSTPVMLAKDGTDGQPGTPGASGVNTAIVYLYKRSNVSQIINWTRDVEYSFTDNKITDETVPSGWYRSIPDGTAPLYVTAATATSAENTDTIAYTEWSTPVVLAKNGTDGANGNDGINAATVFLYKRSASTPAKPTKIITYTFADGSITDADGWFTSVPAGSDPCYIIQATAISREATDTIATSEWTAPVILAQNGSNGNNGRNNATVYLYKRSETAATIGWTNSLTYTFSTGKLSSVPTGWSQNIPDGTAPLYVTAATASATGTTDTIAYTEWSTPVVLALNGKDGTNGSNGSNGVNGLNSATIFLYKRSATAPSKPTRDITYTFATGALSTTDGWSVTIPSGTDPCYVTQATAIANTDTDVIKATEWSSPEILAQNGADGSDGKDGAHGMNTAVVYLYKRSTTGATVDWRNDLTYSFESKAITTAAPTGWSKSIPDGTAPLYVTAATATSAENTDTIAYTEWSTPVVLAKNGTDGQPGTQGEHGFNSATVFLYQRSATGVPDRPSGTIRYTFSDGSVGYVGASGIIAELTGWKTSIPNAQSTEPCYVIQATATSTGAYDDILRSEWTDPTVLVKSGSDGEDGAGINTIIELYYLSSVEETPQKPTSHVSNVDDSVDIWTTTMPTYRQGHFYYTCSEILFDNGVMAWTDPVKASGITSSNANAETAINNVEEAKENFNSSLSILRDGIISTVSSSSLIGEFNDRISKLEQSSSGLEVSIGGTNTKIDGFVESFNEHFNFTDNGLFIAQDNSDAKVRVGNDEIDIIVANENAMKLDRTGLSSSVVNVTKINIGDYVIAINENGHLTIS